MSSLPESAEAGTGVSAPGDTLGRYRLMKKIARGGMAEVFAARSFGAHGFEKTVAIKRILPRYGDDPQFVRMMVDEAKITVLLNHPNVATILELCEQEGDYFIVMEFVPGQSLSGVVKKLRERGERFGVLEACFIVVELLQGLHAAHVQKDASGKPAHIIHRDVSPQNVLLSFDGHVKVIDFGIARARHRLEMTEVGTIKGKLRYLAPEMIDPARFMQTGDFDHRVDVFAAGIVLWELIANRTLYQGDDEMVVYDAITDSDAPDLAKTGACDTALSKIVQKALTRDPEKRYYSAEDFADDLRAYVYRSDPAFTHKRIAAVLERVFPVEKEEMLALERGQAVVEPTRAVPADTTAASPALDASMSPSSAAAAAVFTTNGPPPEPPPPPASHPSHSSRSSRSSRAAPSPKEVTAQAPAERSARSVSHNDAVRPIPPDAATRTAHVSAFAPTLHAEPNEPTRAMRSGESSRKLRERRAGEPAQGDVLTVMRLVSKVGDAVRSRETNATAADDFNAGASTVTITNDKQQAEKRARLSVDETPHTRDRARGPRPPAPRAKPSVILLSAASIAGIAVIFIVAMLLSRPPAPAPLPKHQPPKAKESVSVVVSSQAKGAVAVGPGSADAVPLPASFPALPGDSLQIIVRAPGYEERSVRVSVPQHGAHDESLDVSLRALPVPLTLTLNPENAVVVVGRDDPVPYSAGMLVTPGAPLLLQASAPGYLPLQKEIDVPAAGPLTASLELTQVADEPTPPVRREHPRERAVERGEKRAATLKLLTKSLWGQVTIDGKTYEDTTPLTVELKPGKHTVTVAHPPKKLSKTFSVTLRPGESLTRTVVLE